VRAEAAARAAQRAALKPYRKFSHGAHGGTHTADTADRQTRTGRLLGGLVGRFGGLVGRDVQQREAVPCLSVPSDGTSDGPDTGQSTHGVEHEVGWAGESRIT